MKSILMTGASGYVGSEVLKQLIERGIKVTAIGRSKPETSVDYIKADITNMFDLEKVLKGEFYDCIMHIASLPGDTGDPQDMVKVNVNGCLNMLDYARKTKARRIIIAGSVSSYEWYPATKFNSPDYLPVDEEHPCRPKDMYSTTKRIQELLATTFFEQYDVPATVLRLTAVIGPNGKGGGRSWLDFAKQLAGGKTIKIPHYSPDEICHYIDVRDVARMFILTAEHPAAAGQIFNCCGPKQTKGSQFAEIIKSIVPGIEVEFGFPWSMAQGGEISFDMSKAEKLIGFKPIYSLTDSINNIKQWIDEGGLKQI